MATPPRGLEARPIGPQHTPCPACEGRGQLLTLPSNLSGHTNYYHCRDCGLFWTQERTESDRKSPPAKRAG